MPLDATYRIQSNSGTVDPAATSFTPTLPNPTLGGTTLLLFIGNSTGIPPTFPSVDPPWLGDEVSLTAAPAWRRPNQPAGETSWTISGSSARWMWRVEEWSSWSTVGNPDAALVNSIGSGLQNWATGTVTPDVTDFAALAFWFTNPSSTAVWPTARSYSSGWSETGALFLGTGTGTTDRSMIFAEAYPGASGSLSATLTWDITGGGGYPNGGSSWITCYQPSVPVPGATVLTA